MPLGSSVDHRSKPSRVFFPRRFYIAIADTKKKPSLHVSNEAVRIALERNTKRGRRACLPASCRPFLKLLTFHMTIVLQLQIDFAFGGWKIASALLRSLTRKTLPELWPGRKLRRASPQIAPYQRSTPLHATSPPTRRRHYTIFSVARVRGIFGAKRIAAVL